MATGHWIPIFSHEMGARSQGLLLFNSSGRLYGRGSGPQDALQLLAEGSPVSLVSQLKAGDISVKVVEEWFIFDINMFINIPQMLAYHSISTIHGSVMGI